MPFSLPDSTQPASIIMPGNTHGDLTYTAEIVSLNGDARIRATDSTGTTMLIPYALLSSLGADADTLQRDIRNTINDERRLYAGDAHQYGLMFRETHNRMTLPAPPNQPLTDGTPVLAWVPGKVEDPQSAGWKLYLEGASDTLLGTARWDDLPALQALAHTMTEPESLHVMGSMINGASIQLLTSRIAAATLRTGRKLPAIGLKAVRTILIEAGVPPIPHYSSPGRLGLLTVQSGEKKVPLAVVLTSPAVGTSFAGEGMRTMTANERRIAREAQDEIAAATWANIAIPALEAAGWRVVNLPKSGSAHYSGTNKMFWVTRLNEELWEQVEPAAIDAAPRVNLVVGVREYIND